MRVMSALFAIALSATVLACGSAPASPPPTSTQPPAAEATAAPTAAAVVPAVASPASATPQSSGPASFPATLVDDAGRQVTLQKPPMRIVSLASSNTEILYALGLEDRIVGLDQYSDYPPETRDKPRVGGYAKPDLEQIVALEPDLVVATGIHVKAIVPELERHKLTTVVVDPRDVRGVAAKTELLARLVGKEKEGAALAGKMTERIQAVEARVASQPPVRVFYELSPELHTAGPGSFVDDLLRLAGGTNVAAGAGKEWPQLNQEAVLLADPEVIILGDHTAGETPETVAARPGWKATSAVKNGRIYSVDPNLANRPGPRVVEALDLIAGHLHPTAAR